MKNLLMWLCLGKNRGRLNADKKGFSINQIAFIFIPAPYHTSSSPRESLWHCVAKYRGLLYAGVNIVNIHSSLTNVFVARGLTCDWHRIEFMNICRGAGPRGIMAAPILPIMPIHTHPQSSTNTPPSLPLNVTPTPQHRDPLAVFRAGAPPENADRSQFPTRPIQQNPQRWDGDALQ